MRKGFNKLEKQIGKKLEDGIFQSYFFNGELNEKIIKVYFKFDVWLEICTSDETAIFVTDTYEMNKDNHVFDEGNSFEYPLLKIKDEFPKFEQLIGRRLIDFKELTLAKFEDNITTGIRFYFETGLTFDLWTNFDDKTFLSFDNYLPKELKKKDRNNHQNDKTSF